jgi:hypothetical protein
MSHSANENYNVRRPPPTAEPDAHGQAALMLAESILHTLVEIRTITTAEALMVVQSAQEIKTEVARLAGESDSRMRESLELLGRIAISLEADIH